MSQINLLNTLVILESVLLLVLSLIIFLEIRSSGKMKKSANSKLAAQNDFFPMLVHELRAPLSVIQGAADLLMKSTNSLSAEQIHTLLGQIKASTSTLLGMVGSILDVSKMESGKFQINKIYASMSGILKETCGYFDPLTKMKDIALDCQTGSDLPSFNFDPERLKQVLGNLISNAVKFSSPGGKITILSSKIDNTIQIEVCDTGVGIPDADKPHLFQKFFQASNQNGTEKGTGLGLVISRGIVEAHGGKIWVEDNKPQGTKFIFTLPLK